MEKNNQHMDNENFKVPLEISVSSDNKCPDTAQEMVNAYGTYNIQPTSDTDNDFPAIAQGTPPYMAKRSLKFYRGAKDKNPAKDNSDNHCL